MVTEHTNKNKYFSAPTPPAPLPQSVGAATDTLLKGNSALSLTLRY